MGSPRRSITEERGEPRDWLTRYLLLQKRYDVEIDAALREAMRDAATRVNEMEATGIASVVRSAQLMATMTEIAGALAAFWNRAGDIIRAGQADALRVALRKSFDWDKPLLRVGIPRSRVESYRSHLLEPARFNVEAMIARVYVSRLPLSQQVYKTSELAQGWVERRINSAIGRGEPAAVLAREVRDFINPNTPGGATYAARRLARTEINAAYHAVVVSHNADKPWVEGMRWRLSGSHPTVDVCDEMARRDHHDLGAGVYPRGEVPRKPHPQCFCYTTPETASPAVFLSQLNAGRYNEWMKANYGA